MNEYHNSQSMKHNLQCEGQAGSAEITDTVLWDSQPIKLVLLSSASDVIWQNILKELCAEHWS